jgi:ABC-type lipoprotein export system ATPase subunit
VTGASGRGKSTLLHLTAGLFEPDEGSIRVGGTPIFDLAPGARDRFRGRAIGMIFQTFNLLHGFSALENVMMAMVVSSIPPREHRARAKALLDELGIERYDADPEKLSVGRRAWIPRAGAPRWI